MNRPRSKRERVAGWVRSLRRRVVRFLRKRAAARPIGSRWAFRLEYLARRVARVSKRLERRILSTSSAAEAEVDEPSERVRVTQPLVLISQVGRSGGTLLLHLFDGHPDCLVVPHELSSLLPSRELSGGPDHVFRLLTPKQLAKWHTAGVSVGKDGLAGPRRHAPSFDLSPALLRRLFASSFPAGPHVDRAVLDAYFSAYFTAWRNREGNSSRARWVVGFEPGAIGDDARMVRYDANYFDGRVISVLRDPWSWFVSARRWSLRFAHVEVALYRWRRAVERALAYRDQRPDRIELVAFDDLILDTYGVMDRLSTFLDIPFTETLVMPTINGSRVDNNSSFSGTGAGAVSREPATNRRAQLSDDDAAAIDARVGELWQSALEALAAAKAAA